MATRLSEKTVAPTTTISTNQISGQGALGGSGDVTHGSLLGEFIGDVEIIGLDVGGVLGYGGGGIHCITQQVPEQLCGTSTR